MATAWNKLPCCVRKALSKYAHVKSASMTYLFLPGDRPEHFVNAVDWVADRVIPDIEIECSPVSALTCGMQKAWVPTGAANTHMTWSKTLAVKPSSSNGHASAG